MQKELSQMSLQELWQLFPIFLTEHKMIWSNWFGEEKNILKNLLPANSVIRINHIGSTAINIWAKPIIDILIEIPRDCSMNIIKSIMINNDYICMNEEKNRISFNKGYTKNGFSEKVYHLHLKFLGDNDELYFRDYLIENSSIAKEYEMLKLNLWRKYEFNRDTYTYAKKDFVHKYTQKAKKIYEGRY